MVGAPSDQYQRGWLLGAITEYLPPGLVTEALAAARTVSHEFGRTQLLGEIMARLPQIGPLFGVSHAAAHRVIDTIGPLLALAPVRKRRVGSVAIVDGTLVPTRNHRLAAPSKNYRYSTNVQIAIDADTRLVIATGDPQPGNRNDCIVYRDSGIKDQLADRPAMTDGGYQGNPEVIMPYP